MSQPLPIIYLARHGETPWTLTGQHTGMNDIALTERGERNAKRLGERIAGLKFPHVFTSPLQRARKSCELAGFGSVAKLDADLVEWNYGQYEGKTRSEIRAGRPDWNLFRDGCPGGENLSDVVVRATRVIERLRAIDDVVLLFSSGHFLRVLSACWCGFDPQAAGHMVLSTSSLSMLGYEHDRQTPALALWNETRHVGD